MPMRIATCRRKTGDDEFYTLYRDCEKELSRYNLTGRKIICPCDTEQSNIYKYLKDCNYTVDCDISEWREVNYRKYDIVITNPPFSDVREMIWYFVRINIDFIIVVSDVLRYCVRKLGVDFGIDLYYGRSLYSFLRPDGTIKKIHCGWISSIPDINGENIRVEKKISTLTPKPIIEI